MPGRRRRAALVTAAVALGGLGVGLLVGPGPAGAGPPGGRATWVTGWAGAPSGVTPVGLLGNTLRMSVPVDAPGTAVRVHLANTSVPGPTTFGHVTIGVAGAGPAVRAGTSRTVRFGGAGEVTVAGGAGRWSDPVAMVVRSGERLTVSVFGADAPWVTRVDDSTEVAAWSSGGGDRSADASGAGFTTERVAPWRVVDGIAVAAPRGWSTLVAFGDSITAGYQDHQAAGHPTWPQLLARRLDAGRASCRVSVVNEGISGNQLLPNGVAHFSGGPSGLSRLTRDALSQPGAREVVVQLGTNDISWDATHGVAGGVGQLERAYRALVAAAHARGVRVVAATLTPAGDPAHPTSFVGGYSTPAGDAGRAAVNRWIRTAHAFDAVTDFARAVRSRADHDRLARWADSGDHLHPSTRGDAAMAGAVERAAVSGCPGSGR